LTHGVDPPDHSLGHGQASGMRKGLSGVLGILGFTVAAPAFAVTLECSVPQSVAGGGYITDTYVFHHNQGESTAVASDGVILYYFDAPIEAKVTNDTEKKLVISWDVPMTNSTGQQTRMMYRATFFRQTGQITVRATPGGGYSNSFEGRGSCRPV
jgi:hypothetical protein